MEQVITFQNTLREDLDGEINKWLKKTGAKIVHIRRDYFERSGPWQPHQHRHGILTTVVFREEE